MNGDEEKMDPFGIAGHAFGFRIATGRRARRTMGGVLTGAAVAESMSLTGGAAASASASSGAMAGVSTALGSAGAVVTDAVGSLGTYTVAVGTYTMTAPVVLLATIGGHGGWVGVVRRGASGARDERGDGEFVAGERVRHGWRG